VTELWSGPGEGSIAFTSVPQWSIFQQLADQRSSRIPVHYFGNSVSQAGDIWVDAEDIGPTDPPTQLPPTEPSATKWLPDIEWDEQAGWGPGEAWKRAASDGRQFLEWQLNEIHNAFPNQGGLRLVGPALSEGWPERHDVWLNIVELLYWQFDTLAVHSYTNGQSFDDPNWGGRPLVYRNRFPSNSLLLTKVNDNGHAGIGDPGQRGAEIGQYLAWLGGQVAVELACLFALPGQTVGVQGWWGWSPDVVGSLQAQLQFA
jgi:hypothetical protein